MFCSESVQLLFIAVRSSFAHTHTHTHAKQARSRSSKLSRMLITMKILLLPVLVVAVFLGSSRGQNTSLTEGDENATVGITETPSGCPTFVPPTEFPPTSDSIPADPWPEELRIIPAAGNSVAWKGSKEYDGDLVIRSNVPISFYIHSNSYVHEHPLDPVTYEMIGPTTKSCKREGRSSCPVSGGSPRVNIAAISNCQDPVVDVDVRMFTLRRSGALGVDIFVDPQPIDTFTFLEESSFSGSWSCPEGDPLNKEGLCGCGAATKAILMTLLFILGSTFWTITNLQQFILLVFFFTLGMHVLATSTTKQGSVDQQECRVNIEVVTNDCTLSGMEVDAPDHRVYEIFEEFFSTDNGECSSNYVIGNEFDQGGPCFSNIFCQNQCVKGGYADWERCGWDWSTGRPFHDTEGNSISAKSRLVPIQEAKWSIDSIDESDLLPNKQRLQEWTERAIGEHASVASFAAFAISLMSNNAPPDLIEESLLAAIDEIRHARVSFSAASRMSPQRDEIVIEPGPLESSTLSFSNDLIGLGIVTAKDGCVAETAAALKLATEYDSPSQSSKISDTELAKINKSIAWDEARHAALAFKTIRWICQIDEDACEAIQNEVLNDEYLSAALDEMNSAVRTAWMELWKRIKPYILYQRDQTLQSGCRNEVIDSIDGSGSTKEVSKLSTSILKQLMCATNENLSSE